MENERKRRVTPSMVVATVALVFAVTGSAVAGSLINGSTLKNRSVGGEKLKNASIVGAHVRNFSLPATKLRDDSLTGRQVNESSLVNVHPGTFVTRRMALGEVVEVFRNGPIALTARCYNNGSEDVLDVYGSTTLPGSLMEGSNVGPGNAAGALEPTTPEPSRVFLRAFDNTGAVFVDNDVDEGFIIAPDGSRITVAGDTATLGVNYLGAKCILGFYAVADRI